MLMSREGEQSLVLRRMPWYDSSAGLVLDFRTLEKAEYRSPEEDEDCHNLVEGVDRHKLDCPERDCRNQEVKKMCVGR